MLSLIRTVSRRSRVLTASHPAADAGFSLIEVIVAMFLFAVVALMVASSLITIETSATTGVVRQTATNLAQTQIDLARTTTGTSDSFAALTDIPSSAPIVKTISGRSFYITQHVTWLGAGAGSTTQCSSGSGSFIGKTISVSVTWSGIGSAQPVQLNSIIAPSSRLGSQTTGAILVSVTGANGQPMPGITVTATPSAVPNGATSVPGGAVTTDASGCAFMLNVTPGNYDVAITKSTSGQPYISNNQVYAPVASGQAVAVSSSTVIAFQFDQSGSFPAVFTPPAGITTVGSVVVPSNMNATFENSYGIYLPPVVSISGTSGSFNAHPYSSGYTIMGGDLGGLASRAAGTAPVTSAAKCLDVDPSNWPTSQDASGNWWGPPPAAAAVATAAGGALATAQPVSMGAITLQSTKTTGTLTVAIKTAATPPSSADPGCATGSSYSVSLPAKTTETVLLPFGSWTVTAQTGLTAGMPAGSPSLDSTATVSGNFTVTLDPRVAVAAP